MRFPWSYIKISNFSVFSSTELETVPWSWMINCEKSFRTGRETPRPPISSVSLLLCRSVLVVLELWVWPTGVCWLGERTAGWMAEKHSRLPACHRSLPERASALIPANSHPLIIIPAAVYSLPTQTKHAQRLDTALAREIPAHNLLWSRSILVFDFHDSLDQQEQRTWICSSCTDNINTSCTLGVEWLRVANYLFFIQLSTFCSHLYYLAQRWECAAVLTSYAVSCRERRLREERT